jgi:hypothetical protein
VRMAWLTLPAARVPNPNSNPNPNPNPSQGVLRARPFLVAEFWGEYLRE